MDFFNKLKKQQSAPEPPFPCRFTRTIYDLELCSDLSELKHCLYTINENGYRLAGLTQDAQGTYTVVFSRFTYG